MPNISEHTNCKGCRGGEIYCNKYDGWLTIFRSPGDRYVFQSNFCPCSSCIVKSMCIIDRIGIFKTYPNEEKCNRFETAKKAFSKYLNKKKSCPSPKVNKNKNFDRKSSKMASYSKGKCK
jgi:hypothetical protein